MSSRFFTADSLRNRMALGVLLGSLGLFAGFAVVEYRQDAEVSLLSAINPFRDRIMTVARLLERGEKGRLGRSVKLQGQVTMRSPLLNGVAYQLEDRTGKIWVQSQDTAIQVGQVLTVRGKPIYKEVLLDELDFGGFYLKEKQRTPLNAN